MDLDTHPATYYLSDIGQVNYLNKILGSSSTNYGCDRQTLKWSAMILVTTIRTLSCVLDPFTGF